MTIKRSALPAAALLLAACALTAAPAHGATIAQTATDAGLNHLVSALGAANLVPVFQDPSSTLTVFAPTDAAFESLAAALSVTLEDLLALDTLPYILQYHVLGSEVASSAISDGDTVPTLMGQSLTFSVDAGVKINTDTTVTSADVACEGGIVHVVDSVLLPASLAGVAAADSDFSTLVAALTAADLVGALSAPAPAYTVFAPTNAAFGDLLTELDTTLDEIVADTEMLTKVLMYHVVPGVIESSAVTDGAELTTLSGAKITFSTTSGVMINERATVTAVDVKALNGVIHVIDKVLLPPEAFYKTIAETAADAGLTHLVAAVQAAGLAGAVSDESSSLTVFAPTNAAFEALAAALGVSLADLLELETLQYVLMYHVVGAQVASPAVTDGLVAETLMGQELEFGVADGAVTINGGAATVTAADVMCKGGIVHVIDAVLLPKNIAQLAGGVSDFSTLVGALTLTGLVDTFDAPAPAYTVFAPTNAAFQKTLGDMGMTIDDITSDVDALTTVLAHHVVKGVYESSAVTDGATLTTLAGDDLTFSVSNGGVKINGNANAASANVVMADNRALNGVIHVVDYVLLPAAITDGSGDSGDSSASSDESMDSPAAPLGAPLFAVVAAALALAV